MATIDRTDASYRSHAFERWRGSCSQSFAELLDLSWELEYECRAHRARELERLKMPDGVKRPGLIASLVASCAQWLRAPVTIWVEINVDNSRNITHRMGTVWLFPGERFLGGVAGHVPGFGAHVGRWFLEGPSDASVTDYSVGTQSTVCPPMCREGTVDSRDLGMTLVHRWSIRRG